MFLIQPITYITDFIINILVMVIFGFVTVEFIECLIKRRENVCIKDSAECRIYGKFFRDRKILVVLVLIIALWEIIDTFAIATYGALDISIIGIIGAFMIFLMTFLTYIIRVKEIALLFLAFGLYVGSTIINALFLQSYPVDSINITMSIIKLIGILAFYFLIVSYVINFKNTDISTIDGEKSKKEILFLKILRVFAIIIMIVCISVFIYKSFAIIADMELIGDDRDISKVHTKEFLSLKE